MDKKFATIFTVFILLLAQETWADIVTSTTYSLSTGLGAEFMHYEENDSEDEIHSMADTYSYIFNLEGVASSEKMSITFRASIPISLVKGEEKWEMAGWEYQTNNLVYDWSRFDFLVGNKGGTSTGIYGGLRRSEVTQRRSNFVSYGTPVEANAIEKVKSIGIIMGAGGTTLISDRLTWDYRMEYFMPLAVEVTNNYFPGFKANNCSGYAFEGKTGMRYLYKKSLYFNISLHGGMIHWAGSGMIPYDDGFAKWPENHSNYLGLTLGTSFRF